MAELLVVIVIMTFLCLLYLPRYPNVDYSDYDLINDYLLTQSEAMVTKKRVDLVNESVNGEVYFSQNGNVNQARTINGKKHTIVIHLGNGYITYER